MGVLPPLRRNLDVTASPVPDRPGLLVRDPYQYASAMVIIPSPLVPCLRYFDGTHEASELREALVRATSDIRAGKVVDDLVQALSGGGFLEDEAFDALRSRRHQAFVEAPARLPSHAGTAYPADEPGARETLARYLEGTPAAGGAEVMAVAAPHVSPEGGWRSYAAAYGRLPADAAGRTVVVLGTSHYGQPERFGLTRKPYRTPLGDCGTDLAFVDALVREGGEGVVLEDYCHAVEHSIEFQVLFLQHRLGPGVRVVPVLCGPFARATLGDGLPEDEEAVAGFFAALRALAAERAGSLLWVLGVDMAHIGRRYGDRGSARAGEGPLREVEALDRARLHHLAAGEAEPFWRQVQENGDELRWCGASPLYTFLRVASPVRGELHQYEQWNIDAHSVVSFAGLTFRAAEAEEARKEDTR